jgi:hypothetical protein
LTPSLSTGAQDEVVAFLRDPSTFSEAGVDEVEIIETIETHVSMVFLGGNRVLKLKRAVVFPYLDFSTAENRRLACEAEVRINRRTAPGIYKGVVAVTRQADGALALGGAGEAVDFLVDMHRFDEDTLFDRMAQKGELGRVIMEDLADAIAEFHQRADPITDAKAGAEKFGGGAGIRMIIDNNDACFTDAAGVVERGETEQLTQASLSALGRIGALLDRRRDAGRVRHCHGDLHLRNICIVDGRPTLFDAIEFSDAFANIDVLYDLAFLLMDLDHRGLRRLANIVFNRYFDITGEGTEDLGGMRVMAMFLSVRAAIRCHVDAAQALSLSDPDKAKARAKESSDYLAMATAALTPSKPRLIGVGGLSGSGKSRMARELAPHLGGPQAGAGLGARVVRSDATRKRLSGVALTGRLGPEGYAPEMTERTFDAVFAEVTEALRAGFTVIADAVFASPAHRLSLQAIAEAEAVAFTGIWLEAPPDVMARRVTERTRNASDADVKVLEMQLGYDLGDLDWARVDSAGSRDDTIKAGLDILGG